MLKCQKCKVGKLKVIKEPKGTTKKNEPTKREVDVLVCEKCGNKFGANY